jgi:hypothetical protein
MRLRSAKKRAKQRGLLDLSADYKIINCIGSLAYRIEQCIGLRMAVDHITPFAKGGRHHHANLQAIPHSLNASKRDKTCGRWANPWALQMEAA